MENSKQLEIMDEAVAPTPEVSPAPEAAPVAPARAISRREALATLAGGALAVVAGLAAGVPEAEAASSVKCSTIYKKVKAAYSSWNLSSSNKVTASSITGKVLGVKKSYLSSYVAYRKITTKVEYVCFIAKASNTSNAKKTVSALKSWLSSEKTSQKNYFSGTKGMKLLKNGKYGRSGKYCYLFVLDTSSNSKAVKAFKKAVG